jgi:hypothetical protein
MRRFMRPRGAVTMLTAVAGLAALLIPVSASASAVSSASGTPGAGPNAISIPGVVYQPGGWLDYTKTLASKLTLKDARTATLSGTRAADGSCAFRSAGTAAAGSAATFQEETAFNPQTCQEKILTATLTSADAPILATAAGGTPVSGSARAGQAAAGAAPAATSYSSAYEKTAWIDPLNITITSLADNLRWPLYGAGGTLTARVNPYDFQYDGWSTTGPSPIRFVTLAGNTGWSVNETDHFTNTDFASLVYVVFGVAGWLACGAPTTATAHFNHNVTVYGYRSGSRGWAWNDSVSGACSDLVHHSQWNGFGWTS